MSNANRGFSIQVHTVEGFEIPPSVAAALEQVRVAVAAAENEESEVEGFAFGRGGPELRMGDLMPKLNMKMGGLSLTCDSSYSIDDKGRETCSGKFVA